MYIETPTFQNLFRPDTTDLFILGNDLKCEHGVFKSGTRVRLSVRTQLHSAEYTVISSDCIDSFTLTDSITLTAMQDFFEKTFILDIKATEKAKKALKEYEYEENKIDKWIDGFSIIIFCIGFITSLFSAISFVLGAVYSMMKTKFVFVVPVSTFPYFLAFSILCFLGCYILDKIEKSLINKISNVFKAKIDAILKGDVK